jgi:hypothetical protein
VSDMYRFWIERQVSDNSWARVPFAVSNSVQYCHGFLDAIDCMYPSQPHRLCKRMTPATMKVLRETQGRGAVHLNSDPKAGDK